MNISIGLSKLIDFKKMREIGFDGVDLYLPLEATETDSFFDDYMLKYKEIADAGLAVSQTHLPYWPSHYPPIGNGEYQDFEDKMLPSFIKSIELTKKMNCKTAVIHLYFEADRERSQKGNIQLISKLLPVLEANDVVLAIENIYALNYSDGHLSNAEDLLFYTKHFNNPHVGICLDTGHAVIRGENPLDMLKSVADDLAALHIHTTTPGMDLHALPYFSSYEEKIDWEEFIKTLKNTKYSGSFNLELFAPVQIGKKGVEDFYKLSYTVAKNLID